MELWDVRMCTWSNTLNLAPGDDWEHEEIFTDDDEAVGNDPEEREELAPEIPAPPEIKQVRLVDFLYKCMTAVDFFTSSWS